MKLNLKWLTRFPKDMLCPECGENIGSIKSKTTIARSESIRHHIMKHKLDNFSCDCLGVPTVLTPWNHDKPSHEFRQKERHMKTVHMNWFGCDECVKSFQTVESLNMHREKHRLNVRCSFCNYLAASHTSLRKHSCEPVQCSDCKKIVRGKSKLKAHRKKVHTSLK